MANLFWYSINPMLTENGAFSAFSFEENANEIKPVILENRDDQFSQFRVMQNSYNIQLANQLGIGVGAIDTNFNSFVLSYEAMLFSEKITQIPIGGKIYGTRWGAGIRVNLKISDIKSGIKFDFGAIAANVELGLANVEYELNGIGITKPDIISILPSPGNFNFGNYKVILDAVDNIREYMSKNSNELVAKPFQVYLSDEINNDLLTESKSVVYAMRKIAHRNTLQDALNNIQGKFNASIIKSVYAKFNIFDLNSQPNRDQADRADDYYDF